MLKIKGTYQNGRIDLESNPAVNTPVKVIVTFREVKSPAPAESFPKVLRWADFACDKSRRLLKNLKSSLSEEVTSDRRNS